MKILTEAQHLDISGIWQKTAASAGFTGQGYDFSAALDQTTNTAMNLWVDANGSDSNPGSQALPFLTIQAAIDSIPKMILHPVTINVGAGSFAGFYLNNFQVDGAAARAPLTGAFLAVKGTFVAATGVAGTLSGTVTSGTAGSGSTTTFGTMTVTGAGWTISQLQGKFVKATSLAGVVQYRVIQDNTATVVTICGSWTAPTSTSTFEIIEPGSIINSQVTFPANYDIAGTANVAHIWIANCGATTRPEEIVVEGFKLGVPTGLGIRIYNATPKVRRMWFAGSTGIPLRVGGTGLAMSAVTFEDSYLGVTSSINGIAQISSQGALYLLTRIVATSAVVGSYIMQGVVNNSVLSLASCYFKGFRSGVTQLNGFGTLTCLGSIFDGQDTAVLGFFSTNSSEAPFIVNINGCSISNYATVFDIGSRGALVSLTAVSGTGNTTVISVTKGGRVRIDSTSTITGTTQISVDGVTETFTNMRANSPKTFPTTPNIYGSLVFE